jgi:hypothetical protein
MEHIFLYRKNLIKLIKTMIFSVDFDPSGMIFARTDAHTHRIAQNCKKNYPIYKYIYSPLFILSVTICVLICSTNPLIIMKQGL